MRRFGILGLRGPEPGVVEAPAIKSPNTLKAGSEVVLSVWYIEPRVLVGSCTDRKDLKETAARALGFVHPESGNVDA